MARNDNEPRWCGLTERQLKHSTIFSVLFISAVGSFFTSRGLNGTNNQSSPAYTAPLRMASQEDQPRWVERGAKDVKVDQNQINIQYAQIYDLLKARKEKAEAAGKKLTVLVAEDHNIRDSLLVSFMTVNAARELGIPIQTVETSKDTLTVIHDGVKVVSQERDRQLDGMELSKPKDQLSSEENLVMDAIALSRIFNIQPKAVTNSQFTATYAAHLGIKLAPIDPNIEARKQRIDAGDYSYAADEETAMRDAIVALNSNSLGTVGGQHAAPLKRLLKEAGSDVLLINATNLDQAGLWGKENRERFEGLKAESDLDVVIDGRVTSPGEAILRANFAALTHRGFMPMVLRNDGKAYGIDHNFEKACDTLDQEYKRQLSQSGR